MSASDGSSTVTVTLVAEVGSYRNCTGIWRLLPRFTVEKVGNAETAAVTVNGKAAGMVWMPGSDVVRVKVEEPGATPRRRYLALAPIVMVSRFSSRACGLEFARVRVSGGAPGRNEEAKAPEAP